MTEEKAKSKTSYDVPGARKAIRLIELLCDSPTPLGVAEISRRLDLNKNMVFRLLKTLLSEGWIIAEGDATYSMSLRPFHILSKPVHRMDVVAAAWAPLHDLWEQIGENVTLSALNGDRAISLSQLNSRHEVMIAARTGGRFLLHCGAGGKILLAHAPESLFKHLEDEGFERQTASTICDPEALRVEMAKIREVGYALDQEEYLNGLICYAAPIYDFNKNVVSAVVVSTLTLFHTVESMIEKLGPPTQEAAKKISQKLGYQETD